MKNEIIIQCWSGRILFKGDYRDEQVDKILRLNEYIDENGDKRNDELSVYWTDEKDTRNVYECINY
jgi:hypothetical protein